MENHVWDYISQHQLIEEGQDIGVAVSGGPDSMALLYCLLQLASKHNFQVFCIHFEHGIRGEDSRRDAAFVQDYCKQNSIAHFSSSAHVPSLAEKWGISIESAAKRAREQYFKQLVDEGRVARIATGHHLDDNAESVLMHILRGSGTRGLIGIRRKRGHFIRPLLCIHRADVMRYIKEHNIPSVLDASNLENLYTRNYIRNELLPQMEQHINSQATKAINRLSQLAEEDQNYLSQQAEQAYKQLVAPQEDGSLQFSAQALTDLHPALSSRVIKQSLHAMGLFKDIEYVHIEAVQTLVSRTSTGAALQLPQKIQARIQYGQLIISKERPIDLTKTIGFSISCRAGEDIQLPDGGKIIFATVDAVDRENQDPYSESVDADKLPATYTVRNRWPGDVIHPLGAPGTKKLKDYFIDRKLPREQRDEIVLLAQEDRILWAVGHTLSQDLRVDSSTTHILRATYLPPANNKTQRTGV